MPITRKWPQLTPDLKALVDPIASQHLLKPSFSGKGLEQYLSISEQRWEVEEQRLPQGDSVDGVIKVLTLVKLHLWREEKQHTYAKSYL